MTQRVLLCIMDGWGISKNHPEFDATKLSHPVHVDKLEKEYPTISIHADGEYVGLPEGQMGNSEVGHLNLGAGRIVYQDLSRINRAIKDGSFFKNERFLKAINHAKENDSALHVFGLVSTGGVHSSLDHLLALIKMAAENGLKKVYVHAFLDGRDTPPQSACNYIQPVEDELKKYGLPPVATIIGRYYIMDRDNRWERVEKGYNALLFGEGEKAETACEGVKASYARGDNDEFVLPTVIGGVKQFRTAETEKYAHVTFFFNGGIDEPQPHETRVLVPSPKVATYDMQPEMSAPEVCENVLKAIENPEYGFILVNFANPDMVGHTGVVEAATKACHVVDECVGKIADACKENGIVMLLTADHGNSEVMVNPETGKPQTAHTTNKVPFVLINAPKDVQLKEDGALCNIAPTVLQLMGIKKPAEMDCESLIK